METILMKCTRSRPPAERFVRDGNLDQAGNGTCFLYITTEEGRAPESFIGRDREECLKKAADDGWTLVEESEADRQARNQRARELSILLAAIH